MVNPCFCIAACPKSHCRPSELSPPLLRHFVIFPPTSHRHFPEFSFPSLQYSIPIPTRFHSLPSKLTLQFLQIFIATFPRFICHFSEFKWLSFKFSSPSSKFHCFFSGISPPIDLPFSAVYHNRHYTISSESHPRSGSRALPSSQVLRAITPCHPSRLAATPQERRTPPLPKQPISSCDSAPFALRFSPFRTMKWALLACERGYIAQGGCSFPCLAGRRAK